MRRVAPFLCLLALLISCSKATRVNYDQIENGMNFAEVVEILGEPSSTDNVGVGPFSAGTATWEGPDGNISIQFLNEKVQMKSLHPKGEDGGDKDE